MGLTKRLLDRRSFKRENTVLSMRENELLEIGDIVKVAETGYFYDIGNTGTVALNNGLFATVKQTTFLQLVTTWINNLTNLTNSFNTHTGTMASTGQAGHMSAADKTKLNGLSNYSLGAATKTTLGGVIVGDNLMVDGNGRVSASVGTVVGDRNAGYIIHPGGFIEQWLYSAAFPTHNGVYNFPIAFPNDCLNIIIGRNRVRSASGNDSEGIGALYRDRTTFVIQADMQEPGFWVRACGY